MQKNFTFFRNEFFPISLILILAFSRLIPHPPNFTPIIAVAIMSGYFFKNIYLSIVVIFLSMLATDTIIGFYTNMIFVYLSLFFIVITFFKFNFKIKLTNLFIFGFAGSILFFMVSNFGVWLLSGMYERSLAGMTECYIAAIPFLKIPFFQQ